MIQFNHVINNKLGLQALSSDVEFWIKSWKTNQNLYRGRDFTAGLRMLLSRVSIIFLPQGGLRGEKSVFLQVAALLKVRKLKKKKGESHLCPWGCEFFFATWEISSGNGEIHSISVTKPSHHPRAGWWQGLSSGGLKAQILCTYCCGITQLFQQTEISDFSFLTCPRAAQNPNEMWKGITPLGSKRCWKSKEIGQKRIGNSLEGSSSYFLVTWVSWALQFNLSKCFIWHCWLFSSSPGTGTNIYISLILVAELQIFQLLDIKKSCVCSVDILCQLSSVRIYLEKLRKTNLLAAPK